MKAGKGASDHWQDAGQVAESKKRNMLEHQGLRSPTDAPVQGNTIVPTCVDHSNRAPRAQQIDMGLQFRNDYIRCAATFATFAAQEWNCLSVTCCPNCYLPLQYK